MGKLIDADKLKDQILNIYISEDECSSGEPYAALYGALMRSKILEIINQQPEVKVPFKAVAEIKIDDDKLRKICKEQLEAVIKQNPNTLQPEPKDSGWIPLSERRPTVYEKGSIRNTIWKVSKPVAITYDYYVKDIKIATMARKELESGDFKDYWYEGTSLLKSDRIKAWRPLPEPYMRDEKP